MKILKKPKFDSKYSLTTSYVCGRQIFSGEISLAYGYGFCFAVGKLMDLHGEGSGSKKGGTGEGGEKVDRPEGYEPPVMETV